MPAKELIVVAGPNGSGKTTFAEELLKQHPYTYLSADLIAAELSPDDPTAARIAAGREFLCRVEQHLAGSESFLVESTLSGSTFRRVLEKANLAGFEITINFIAVDSVETCVARVQERVRKGGHDVPEADIRRRFARALANFWHVYKQIAHRWFLLYNGSGEFIDVAIGKADVLDIRDEPLFREFLMLAGVQAND